MSKILDPLKENLYVNKVFLSGTVVWSIVVSIISGVPIYEQTGWCASLRVIWIVGLTIAVLSSIIDTFLEIAPDVDAQKKRSSIVYQPTQQVAFLPGAMYGTAICYCCTLHLETVIRMISNIVLFVFFVWATAYKWFNDCKSKCRGDIGALSNPDALFGLLIASIAATLVRMTFAWTYKKRTIETATATHAPPVPALPALDVVPDFTSESTHDLAGAKFLFVLHQYQLQPAGVPAGAGLFDLKWDLKVPMEVGVTIGKVEIAVPPPGGAAPTTIRDIITGVGNTATAVGLPFPVVGGVNVPINVWMRVKA